MKETAAEGTPVTLALGTNPTWRLCRGALERSHGWRTSALLIAVWLTISATAMATPGDLDPTFGTGGRVFTWFPLAAQPRSYGIALQPDGKIVAVGNGRRFGSKS